MKKFLLASVALSAMAGAATAADLPYRRAAPAPAFVAVPVFTWTGLYAGINAGYAFSSEGTVTTTPLTPAASFFQSAGVSAAGGKVKPEGFIGGGQIGYNWQFGSVVLGAEADIQYTDLDKTTRFNFAGGNFTTYRSSIDYLGTVRGRVGYAWDRWMIYATGGLAYAEVENRHFDGTGLGVAFAGVRKGTETGYAVGAGVEYAMPMLNFGSSAATVKVEYLYYDLGKKSVTSFATTTGAPSFVNRFSNDGHIVRAGLNWKFSAY